MTGAARLPRVLLVHPADELYGADRVLLEVVDLLALHAECRVVLPRDVEYPAHLLSDQLRLRGVPVTFADVPILRRAYLRPSAVPALVRRMWTARRLLRALRPDVVYLSTSATFALAPFARSAGTHVVFHVHETWGRLERRLLGGTLAASHTVLAVSADVARRLPPRVPVRVVHNGFEVPAVDEAAAARLRRSIGARDDDVVALVASRWNSWKGHDVLLAAWAGLVRDDVHLVVLGSPPPSGSAVDVGALVAALPDRTRVHVVGESERVPDWVTASDVVLVPSSRPDPLPTIALEAAALGRAVLGSDSGGLPDIVEAGVTGGLVPTGDSDAWRAAIEALDLAVLHEQGMAARARFAAGFTRAAFRERLGDALASAVGHGATSAP